MLRQITIASLAIATTIVAEDHLSLANGDRFSGKIQAINEDHTILFQLPIATEPLLIETKGLSKITFDTKTTKSEAHSERIYLVNGDELPCSLKKVDENVVSFTTDYAGDFEINRDQVTKISFENKLESLVYHGPGKASEWETFDSWKIINDSMTVNGKGTAAKKLDLPNNFILRFDLAWKGDNPKLRVHFGGRENTTNDKINRYYIDYNKAGFQMTRVTQRKFDNLGTYTLRPADVKNNRFNVELHVDRQSAETILYVDGNKLTTFSDDADTTPLGGWLIFESNQTNGQNMTIGDLRVLEWAGTNLTKQKQKEIVDEKTDILRDNQNLRYTGQTKKIEKVGDNLTIFFDSKFAKDTLQVPSNRASVLHFRKPSNKPELTEPTFVADLAGGGKISLSKTTLNDDTATTSHPILGSCTIKRSAINTLSVPQ